MSMRLGAVGLLAECSAPFPWAMYSVSRGLSLPVCSFQVMGRARLALRSNTGLLVDLASDRFRVPVKWKGVARQAKEHQCSATTTVQQ